MLINNIVIYFLFLKIWHDNCISNNYKFKIKKNKNMKKLLIIFAFTILGSSAFAQVSATATSSATVITPIEITKIVDLNFGTLAVSPTNPGTVILTPGGTRTKTGGVTLPNVSGTVTAAKFTVTGLANSTYTITLPSSVILNGPSSTMTINAINSTPTATGTLNSGTEDIFVGGTLNVIAAQPAGFYTNTTDLTVTVNYN